MKSNGIGWSECSRLGKPMPLSQGANITVEAHPMRDGSRGSQYLSATLSAAIC